MKPIFHPKCDLIESFMARYHMSELRFEIFAHLMLAHKGTNCAALIIYIIFFCSNFIFRDYKAVL